MLRRYDNLQLTKMCPQSTFAGEPGSYCTITSSNVPAIEVDSRIVYLSRISLELFRGREVVLDPPGPGNNKAFGTCSLLLEVCTFSGGAGKFTWFQARVDVSHAEDFSEWYWEGTYSFSPQD